MNKLYTKEQMIKAFRYGKTLEPFDCFDDFIESLTPIELPTDEEVYQEAKSKGGLFLRWDMYETSAFVMGAQWMRDKIKGGSNETI